MKNKIYKNGGVSMFVVATTCILITLLVASFIRLMSRDQESATLKDSSSRALDSAQAGVEASKNFLSKFYRVCDHRDGKLTSTDECRAMDDQLAKGNNGSCNMLNTGGIGSKDGETPIQSTVSSSGKNIDQAYTCVKIQRDTPDFLGSVGTGKSHMVPLRGLENFSAIRISWHSVKNMSGEDTRNLDLEKVNFLRDSASGNSLLLNQRDWNAKKNRPALLKVQFMGYYDRSTNPNSRWIDFTKGDTESFASSRNGYTEQIYYPADKDSAAGLTRASLPRDRRSGNITHNVTPVKCEKDITVGNGYACSIVVDLGRTVFKDDIAFARLTPLYKDTEFKVELIQDSAPSSSNNIVKFAGVQPKIDSTGRANNSFRRIESRIEFYDPNFPIPDFAIHTEGSDPFCKDFWVTDNRNSGNIARCQAE